MFQVRVWYNVCYSCNLDHAFYRVGHLATCDRQKPCVLRSDCHLLMGHDRCAARIGDLSATFRLMYLPCQLFSITKPSTLELLGHKVINIWSISILDLYSNIGLLVSRIHSQVMAHSRFQEMHVLVDYCSNVLLARGLCVVVVYTQFMGYA